jgi:hypothetical protein
MASEAGFPLPLEGGCRCGRIGLRVTQAPTFSFACHCTDCQTLSGSAFSLGLAVADRGVEVRGETHVWAKTAESGHTSRAHTCPDCTTWLFTRTESTPGVTVLRPSALQDHSWFRPIAQIYTRSAMPWALLPTQFSYATEFQDPQPLIDAFALGGIRPGT